MKFIDIMKATGGQKYLEWIARDMGDKPNIQEAAKFVLKQKSAG